MGWRGLAPEGGRDEPIVGIIYGTSIIPSHWDATIYAGIGVHE
jgi:hypothetical protein